MKNIFYLTGFMGAGKSTIGPILANTLGWEYFDLDRVIEQQSGVKIKEIFESKGEPYFRQLESEVLKELSGAENSIISLGGGTMVNPQNLILLRKTGKIIYLKTTPEAVLKRLIFKRDRPVFKPGDFNEEAILKSKIEKLFNARKQFYEQADFTINTDRNTVGKTVDIIAHLINSQIKAGGEIT